MSSRRLRAPQRSNKIAAVTSLVEAICRQQLAIADTPTEADMKWMKEEMQLFQRLAQGYAGLSAGLSSTTAKSLEQTSLHDWQAEKARIDGLLVKELRLELAHLGMSTDGRKIVLQERLKDVMLQRYQQQSTRNKDVDMDIEEDVGLEKRSTVPPVAHVDQQELSQNVGDAVVLSPIDESGSLPMITDKVDVAQSQCRQQYTHSDKKDAMEHVGNLPEDSRRTSRMSLEEVPERSRESTKSNRISKMSIDEAKTKSPTPNPLNSIKMSIDDVGRLSACRMVEELSENNAPSDCSEPLQSPDGLDRKRSRSPLRNVQVTASHQSPNRSLTKVQKTKDWPQSQSKLRQSVEDVSMLDNVALGHTYPTLPTFNRPLQGASAVQHPPSSIGAIPRTYQPQLSASKLLGLGSVPVIPDAGATSSVLKDDTRKKNADRINRINNLTSGRADDRIRTMSKPVPLSKALQTSAPLSQSFSVYKSVGKINTSATSDTRSLTQKMRDAYKSNAKAGEQAVETVFGSGVKSSIKSLPMASLIKAPPVTESLKEKVKPCPMKSTPAQTYMKDILTSPLCANSNQRPPPQSPFDTYEMSDGEDFSVDSDDEEERDRKAKKYIPKWARSPNLKVILAKQNQRTDDPDDTFFRVTTCDLEAIFGKQPHKNYHVRASTGDWGDDRMQPLEHLIPKRSAIA